MQENIFCLNSDNTVSIVKPGKLFKHISHRNVSYILIPIGVYSNEYCVVTPNIIPYGLDELTFEYELCLQAFDPEDAIYEKVYEGSLSSSIKEDGIIGLYKMIHSIYNINGVNAILNAEMSDDFLAFVFEYFKVHARNGKKVCECDSRDVSVKEACPYSSNSILMDSRAPYILYCIDDAIKSLTHSSNSAIPSLEHDRILCIDTARSEWVETASFKPIMKNSIKSDKSCNNLLVSMVGMNFNSITFVNPVDINILSEFDHYMIGYILLGCSQSDYDDSDIMASETVQDLYDNKLLDNSEFVDSSVGLYELASVVECANHLKYIFKTIQMANDKMYGIFNRIILYISFSTCGDGLKKRDYIYSITDEDVEEDCNRDFLSEFIATAEECLLSTPRKKDENYERWFY